MLTPYKISKCYQKLFNLFDMLQGLQNNYFILSTLSTKMVRFFCDCLSSINCSKMKTFSSFLIYSGAIITQDPMVKLNCDKVKNYPQCGLVSGKTYTMSFKFRATKELGKSLYGRIYSIKEIKKINYFN